MSTSTGNSGGNGSGDPWAWLGLLKWTLSYTDGTKPSSESMQPLSPEDKAFLEKVMKEGIIDVGGRMNTILSKVTDIMTKWKEEAQVMKRDESKSAYSGEYNGHNEEEVDRVNELLQELRDIVEQIDYARAFQSMKGLNFVLGAVTEMSIPVSVRIMLLGILATASQENPPVQMEMLELGAIATLTDVFYANPESSILQTRCMQALSAMIRSNETCESVFEQVPTAPQLMLDGLSNANTPVIKRTLFLLIAFLTSDTSSKQRIHAFSDCITYAIDKIIILRPASNIIIDSDSTPGGCPEMLDTPYECMDQWEIREMVLQLLIGIMEQKKSVNVVLRRKDSLVTTGDRRVRQLGALNAYNREHPENYDHNSSIKLKQWELLLALIRDAEPDADEIEVEQQQDVGLTSPEPAVLMLEANKYVHEQ